MELSTFGNTSIYVPSDKEVQSMKSLGKDAFWAKVWPSSQALASFVINNHQLVTGKNVIEIAAGLGLPSITTAYYAKRVVCSDLFPRSFSFVEASARLNGLNNIRCHIIDWKDFPPDFHTDVVLMSDVNYDSSAFPDLEKLFSFLLNKNTMILLATPQRVVARNFIASLLPYCVHQEEIITDGQLIHIFRLQKQVAGGDAD